jgi:CHAT domain-containing protein/Tfp pilus assembly protein PilF
MIHPLLRSILNKYHSWVVYCGLILSVSLPLVRIQASPDALGAGTEVKSYASVVNSAQEKQLIRQLEQGKPIEREFAGGQSHSYQITPAAGRYVKLVVDQRGIDIEVKLSGSDGNEVIKFDSEKRTQGQETVEWVAEEEGGYRLDVAAKYKSAAAGRYEIQVVELRVATENDRALFEARKLNAKFLNLYRAGKYDEARPLVERELEIHERVLGSEHPDIARALNNLANICYMKGDYITAEPLYQRALRIKEKTLGPEHPEVATYLNNLALLYEKKGHYAKAEPFYQRALIIREKALEPSHPDVAASLNSLALLYNKRGDYAQAEQFYQRALAIREKSLGPEHTDVAISLNNLASLYWDKGDYARAEPLYGRALIMREKALGREHPDVAISLNNLANLHWSKGDYARAEPLFGRALTIYEKSLGPEHLSFAAVLFNLASLYSKKGDYARAEPFYQRSLAITEKSLGSEHPYVALCLNNLALNYSDSGDYAKAEPLLQRALAIREKVLGLEHPDVAVSLNNLATSYRERGDYAKAESLSQRALAIQEKALGLEHPDTASFLTNLAGLYRDTGDYAKAEQLNQRALIIREKVLGPEHPDVAESLNGLARLYAAKGAIGQAVASLSRANAVDERNFALNLATGSERQKLAYLSLFSRGTDLTLSLQSQTAPNDLQALDLALTTLLRRKGRGLDAMTDTIATLRRHATPQDQKLFDKLADARSQLAALTLKDSDAANPDTYLTRVKPIEIEVDKLEAELSSRSAKFRAIKQPVTLATIQAALPPDSTLVEFAYFTPLDLQTQKSKPPRYLAYLLAAQDRPRWVDLGEAAPIDDAVDAWRQALRDNRVDAKRLARQVDEKVMQPVRSLLQPGPGQIRHLLIAPDGSLNLIPFAALVDEQNQYLIERYNISYLTSGRDLLRLQDSPQSHDAPLVVADPHFGTVAAIAMRGVKRVRNPQSGHQQEKDGKRSDPAQIFFRPLPGTKGEALAIKAVLPEASVLLQQQATEAALKQTRAPRILHIATHGFFLSDVEEPSVRSGLALSGANRGKNGDDDGVLTALEMAGLDLWGTRLVVLSACDTGVGAVKNGEGVQGLRRALVLAGSESQVMSLWPVTDEGAKELMIEYYKALQQGEGRSEGLRQVQLRMLRGRTDRRHPFYWAAFIQSGEWANLDGKR